MAPLQWSDTLALGVPAMDATHHEFVTLLDQVVHATDDTLLPMWRLLVAHTEAHFAREDQWMHDTGYASTNCHTSQHQVVLQVMIEGDRRASTGELSVVRQIADELGTWFPMHAQVMDYPLAMHLCQVSYDPLTGQVNLPQALPASPIKGCDGASCSPAEATLQDLAVPA